VSSPQLQLQLQPDYPLKQYSIIFDSLGFRFLFVAIPFAFYAIGPLALLIATGVILLFSYHHDFNFPEHPHHLE
jgi:hypothetical protein